jgi:hypothetical protein
MNHGDKLIATYIDLHTLARSLKHPTCLNLQAADGVSRVHKFQCSKNRHTAKLNHPFSQKSWSKNPCAPQYSKVNRICTPWPMGLTIENTPHPDILQVGHCHAGKRSTPLLQDLTMRLQQQQQMRTGESSQLSLRLCWQRVFAKLQPRSMKAAGSGTHSLQHVLYITSAVLDNCTSFHKSFCRILPCTLLPVRYTTVHSCYRNLPTSNNYHNQCNAHLSPWSTPCCHTLGCSKL